MKLQVIWFLLVLVAVSCQSEQTEPVQSEEAPRVIDTLHCDVSLDSASQRWALTFHNSKLQDTIWINSDARFHCALFDTANVDGAGLPECIVRRDSIYFISGINQRGDWGLMEQYVLLDVWNLEEKRKLFSLKKEVLTNSWSTDLPGFPKRYGKAGEIEDKDIEFYRYQIHFAGNMVTIDSLEMRGSSEFKPDYPEGVYLIRNDSLVPVKPT